MKSFELSGDGIDLRLEADSGALTANIEARPDVDSFKRRGYEEVIPAENLVLSTSEMGTIITGVLVKAFRDGSEARLSVIVPSEIRQLDEAPVTGVAIIILDRSGSVKSNVPMQAYDVRQLTGVMRN